MENPYGPTGPQTPFKGFIGRTPGKRKWWISIGDEETRNLVAPNLEYPIPENNTIFITGFKGIVVDATCFRITGKSKTGDVRIKSNLCNHAQTTLKVVREFWGATGRTGSELIDISNQWKNHLKGMSAPGKYTKTIAMVITTVFLENGKEVKVNMLTELRLASTQMFSFTKWQSKVKLDDKGMFGMALSSIAKNDFESKDDNGANTGYWYGVFNAVPLPEDHDKTWAPVIVDHWESVKKYVLESAPGASGDTSPEEVISTPGAIEEPNDDFKEATEPKPYTKASHPMDAKNEPPGNFPTVDDERNYPPNDDGGEDDLPF